MRYFDLGPRPAGLLNSPSVVLPLCPPRLSSMVNPDDVRKMGMMNVMGSILSSANDPHSGDGVDRCTACQGIIFPTAETPNAQICSCSFPSFD
eukprot:g23004.t1